MTDEETVALGDFCEHLMQSAAFNVLHEMFKQQQIENVFHSAPEAVGDRERAYTELRGVMSFLGLMKTQISLRDNTISRNDHQNQSTPIEDAYPYDHLVEGDLGTVPL